MRRMRYYQSSAPGSKMAVADKAKADVVRRLGPCRVTGNLSATLAGREASNFRPLCIAIATTTFQQKLSMKSSLVGLFLPLIGRINFLGSMQNLSGSLKLRSTANRQQNTCLCSAKSPNLPINYYPCVSEMTSNCGETHVFSEDGRR
jgi:hypothetical protein